MHTCGIQKNGTDQPMCRAGIDTQMWRMDVWTWGGGRRGWNEQGDLDWHIYTTMCKIDSEGEMAGWHH